MKNWHIAVIILAVAVYLHDFKPKKLCYEITEGQKDTRQVLLNRCTGDTWMLALTNLVDDKGKQTGSFTYQWEPLTKNNYGELRLTTKN